MINHIIIDPRTQKFVETSANTLNQAIIGATNFVEKYYSDLAKEPDKLSKSLAREGENLSKITRDYLRAIKGHSRFSCQAIRPTSSQGCRRYCCY